MDRIPGFPGQLFHKLQDFTVDQVSVTRFTPQQTNPLKLRMGHGLGVKDFHGCHKLEPVDVGNVRGRGTTKDRRPPVPIILYRVRFKQATPVLIRASSGQDVHGFALETKSRHD